MAERGEDFADYCWSFTDGRVLEGDGVTLPASTPLSERISKDLKKRGFKFVGPTIVYAWMQATGIVDDHSRGCFRRHPGREAFRACLGRERMVNIRGSNYPKLAAKLQILADAAKYDASCASSGAPKRSAARPGSARPPAPASATPIRPMVAAFRS